MMIHHWFAKKPEAFNFAVELAMEKKEGTELSESVGYDQRIPQALEVVRFTTLDGIPMNLSAEWTYYRPKSSIFALDAFIIAATGNDQSTEVKCYGLHMAIEKNSGMETAGMNKFLSWIKARQYTFECMFVVPPELESVYKW
ncbi:hypothetical protein BBJ29_009816 [Phytophthora kernoviae]|uniref:Uncharacterized protein n=1 Tax=Phytophthora kernoviae TaxID=325452 RepID=A0A421FZC9_9STRA|nr:hypothetical protein BBJ29_009816 [Phytophthora kernoviae]